LAESHSRSSPAFNELIGDYRNYHVALLVFGGLVELLVVSFCIFSWTKARRAPRTETGKRSFEKRTYLGFALFTTMISLAFALGLVANLTTVLNPWPGFNSLVASLANPQPGTQTATLFHATNAWIQSGSAHMPAAVHAAVEHRLSWQRPRAIVSTVLMVVFLLISVRIWRRLIERSRAPITQRRFRERAFVFVGLGAVVATLLFTVLAVSNMRGTIAPVAITVLQAGH
jgi:heme/copper-type cytochrome/quinol oxidase subunit 3